MIKIITVIGARPQIIKAAALSRAISNKFKSEIEEIIVHTGQHYDANMSGVFFDELNIPKPHYNLNTGSGSHGVQTAAMIVGIEEILVKEKPQAIVLYGDTNSTLAGAIAASKIHIPIIHIEAGLRSFNKAMPEEINRIMCDHASTLLFSPTKTGFANLLKEGFRDNNKAPYNSDNPKIYHCGDVMYDNSLFFSAIAEEKTSILNTLQLENGKFVLATIHRNNNTDDPTRLTAIFKALNRIAVENKIKVVLPLHPRTSKLLNQNLEAELLNEVKNNGLLHITEPASFLEMIALEKNCKMVITDSGGVQKEAFYFEKPCIILRPETEWVELVECGTAVIADANEKKIVAAYQNFLNANNLDFPKLYGDGHAAEFICAQIVENFKSKI
ncbi:MAG: UDP-N-acetylglucosamine 2-epimerase (non-hydrolyzing) [Sphingobacteriaceae bacterium]|nr:UDP-N-acetylglucosamine 2-epimerase (non-hydrolyzing) [Sphingobacteriaceae bacterium]